MTTKYQIKFTIKSAFIGGQIQLHVVHNTTRHIIIANVYLSSSYITPNKVGNAPSFSLSQSTHDSVMPIALKLTFNRIRQETVDMNVTSPNSSDADNIDRKQHILNRVNGLLQ